MSQTYVSQIVIVLALVLPRLGLSVGSDELTSLVQGLAVAGGVLWTLWRRYQAGGLTIVGSRTE